jgi:hypothetical protein
VHILRTQAHHLEGIIQVWQGIYAAIGTLLDSLMTELGHLEGQIQKLDEPD